MKTILWCVVTTAIGAFAGPQFPSADSNSLWLGAGIGLLVGAIMSSLPIFPPTWVERIQQLILWRPNRLFWRNVQNSLAHLIIAELYLVLFGASLLTMTTLSMTSRDALIETYGTLVFLACFPLPLATIFLLCLFATDINIISDGEYGRPFHEEFNMVRIAQGIRHIALFYNPFVLPFTLLYHGAKALRVIR